MNDSLNTDETIRCPTCRAAQTWSDECRRCRADLRLLRSCAARAAHARRKCLMALSRGQSSAALEWALELHELAANDDSRRLMAVVAFADGDFETALLLSPSTASQSE